MPVNTQRYFQDEEGLWVEKVGPWAKRKLEILTSYVQISSKTRAKYSHCAFLDVFSGPGRSQVRDTGELIDGSPVAAFKQSIRSHPFSAVYVSDANEELLASATTRLKKQRAPVRPIAGPAREALPSIVQKLSPSGLHLALLDPHNLGALSFDLFESLDPLRRIDVIVHVSLGDLQRNLDLYTSDYQTQFNDFAPGWRDHIRTAGMNQVALRAAILEYWTEKLVRLGLPRAEHLQLIRGTNNQRLYWLMLLARHELAHEFWEKITSIAREPEFDF